MAAFPGYTLESIGRLTLIQFYALQEQAQKILEFKAKTLTL